MRTPVIPADHVKSVCKPGQAGKTCRYLIFGVGGFRCAKLNQELKDMLDGRVAEDTINAKGDNCPGYGVIEAVG